MATTRISTGARNAACNSVVDLLDGGSGPGYIEIRSGSMPASVATAASGTLLATLTLSDPAFGSSSTGTATAGAVTADSSADATGTAGWFRAYDSTGTAVLDGDVTATGGGGAMTLSSTAITAGSAVNVTGWTVTMPAG